MKSDFTIRSGLRLAQWIMNLSLCMLLLFLVFFMYREVFYIGMDAFNNNLNVHEILDSVINFFLYFAFVSMIVVYFKEHYHFPLRYLLYIGITATLRFIIVNRSPATENLILSLVIVLLIVGYILLTPKGKERNWAEEK